MINNSNYETNSIFEQPWWLEAVAPGKWDEVVVKQNEEIIARLPFVKKKYFGCKLIGVPEYTQTTSCWIKDTGAKNTKKYAREKDLITELIQQLPKGYSIDLYLDHNCDYLFPFYWNGFSLQLNYSYRLEAINDPDLLWSGLADNIRREIKKAQKIVKVEDNHSVDDLIAMQDKTFARQGREFDSNRDLLLRLDQALIDHNARKLLCAVDDNGKIHAAAYFVYDKNCCYYLIGGGDPKLRNSGSASLLMWEGIKFASTVSESFDFEGSMIESIERFFRGFGGVPTPYWRVTRLSGPLKMCEYLKPKVKRILGWK